jgi:quercetin dioxygenase-like cupin family protein
MNASGLSRRNAIAGLVAAATGSALAAQDAAKVQPRSYRVVFENNEVRVLEYSSVPGMGVCGTGVHSHPRHLNIALTPSRVRVSANGKSFVATNKEGDVWYEPAVTHEAENISGHGVRALMVEFKAPPPRA